ncbi:MAG: sigma 54-interacting transcriptional regulator [Proteobacteria bacterium]|nr:sigma 54-interacting transcriptional regulator [Pseudomonadota bacterium]MBU2227839.1 sigma 54-interacting transcriptional regulator [Pseudomonadota bacterium]
MRELVVPKCDNDSPLDRLRLLELILDNIYNGVIVTDAEGYVIYFNKPYGQFLGIDPEAQIGKHATEVIENTRMHIVAKTGKAEINKAHNIKGQDMVVQRIPIKQDGKVVAVFGQVMFKHVSDVGKLARALSFLQSKLKLYEEELLSLRAERYTFDSILGTTPAILNLKKEALRAAATNFPVLLTGESGTGKEMFAQAIHNASPRRLHPFIRINCASIPKDLIESELFGYEKGAFTGASPSGKYGKLELANNGTVFLDEIGDMPDGMQPKILRVLEEKELERIGGTAPVKSDFRLIAASNQPLEEMVNEGRFRKDLYYRLNVIRFHLPPLRERRDDILPIARSLLKGMAENSSFPEIKIHPAAEEILLNYDWPGNIRELVNVLSRVTCLLERDTIQPYDIPFFLRQGKETGRGAMRTSLDSVVDAAERDAVVSALASASNNKTAAAALLGIHRTHLYKKMKKYGI